MKILKASNKNGQSILWSAKNCDGHTLNDIYKSVMKFLKMFTKM